MVSFRSGVIQWAYTCNGSTTPPDAYQLRVGTASGTYSVCSCFSSATFIENLRTLVTRPGTYYVHAIGSASGTTVACSTETVFTFDGNQIRVTGG